MHAFIGRLIRHIPEKHFKMVRYGGLFTTRWRTEHLADARRALGQRPAETEPASAPISLSTWRERRQAQDGIDPLRCSHCGRSMQLREVAFGPHARIAELFRRAAHPLRPLHPALARPP